MPITLRGPRKAMRGKCERGQGSANADGAGAKVFAGDGCSQGRLSAPWPRFHGVDRADVYIIIHVRACCCGECALNPPPSQFTPRRRPPLAPTQRHAFPEHFRSPTQRHAFPEHFRSPTQPRRTPAGCSMYSSSTAQPIPRSDTLPLLPFRFGHKKNGTAQWMCDAECLGRPSLRSVIGVGEPRAVRRRCGALAWRVGLRPQPWALRSRRCGRVLRA